MKSAVICLSLLTLTLTSVACGKKGSKDKTSTAPNTSIDNPVDPTDSSPNPGSGTGNSNGSTPGKDVTGTGTGTGTGGSTNSPLTSPIVGLYLGTCEIEGTIGISSGIEITSTHIFPATALFSANDCAKESLIAWGHTGDYPTFETFAAYSAEKSKAAGNETVASFDDKAIKLTSKATGTVTSLNKTKATLSPDKRLKVFVSKHTVDIKTGVVSGELTLTKGPLTDGEFDIGFYCENAEKKIVRQESRFTVSATGIVSFVGKLNTWAPVPPITTCQVTLAALQKASGSTQSHDVAWSQFIDVK